MPGKCCRKCGTDKPLTEFSKNNQTRDGIRIYCKTCVRASTAVNKKNYNVSCAEKDCTACGTRKPFEDFYRDPTKTDGLHSYCKTCQKAHTQRHRDEYPDEVKAAHYKWMADDPERKRKSDARSYRKHAEKRRATCRAYYLSHIDYYYALASARRALMKSATVVPFTAAQLRARWEYYGNACWMCGAPATATDHVKPLTKGGAHMLCNLRPACQPCNNTKSNKWPFVAGATSQGI